MAIVPTYRPECWLGSADRQIRWMVLHMHPRQEWRSWLGGCTGRASHRREMALKNGQQQDPKGPDRWDVTLGRCGVFLDGNVLDEAFFFQSW